VALHASLFCTNRYKSAKLRFPPNSRILSLYLVFGLPFPIFLYTAPINKSVQMSPFLHTCPTKAIFRLTMVVSSLSLVTILLKTYSLVFLSVHFRWGTSRKSIFYMVIARKLKTCKQGNIDALISNLEEIFQNGAWLPW